MNRFYFFIAACLVVTMMACSEKKKSDDIITETVERPQPQAPIRSQVYADSKDISWIGRTYRLSINRQPSDSLPMVKDEIGQEFVDNCITLKVSRQDSTVFYNRTFTKRDFDKYLDNDYRATGILEGIVFNKADRDWLEFAASVCHPQTDEYIPLIIRLSRMGELSIKRDTQLDTSSSDSDGDADSFEN